MHEASLMKSALDLAWERTCEAGCSRIHRLRLRVGEMSGVVPEALEFAFAALAPGGPAEGAFLEIEPVPSTYWCERCEVEFGSGNRAPECPQCGEWSHRLLRGLELELASMEVT